MDTVLRSRSKTVTIGAGQPFCIIGERINPTGRKTFAEELRGGDLSTVTADALGQVAAGADMLDVNAGIPLVDEPELLKAMLKAAQDAVDAPICIDSSVIEALEAGLSVYEGRALVNSVTAEDDRLQEILPLVARHDAAVIGLANDETGIPETPEERLRHARKIVDVAGQYGIAAQDVVIDPLAMTVGADTEAVTTTLRTISLIRDELGVNMCLGASNVSFGLPRRHALNAGFLPMAMAAGLTSAIMSTAEVCVQAVRAPTCCSATTPGARAGSRRTARRWRWRRKRPRRRESRSARAAPRITRAPAGPEAQPGDGSGRVRLRFLPDGGEFRVPSGTPVFDAASWNGIAIDSTCGGYGTCKKCKVRIVHGDVPVGAVDPRAFSAAELADGWRLACRAAARGDLVVEVPPLETRPKAALVGVGRHVILRPSVQKRHLVLEEPSLEDQRSDLQRVLDGIEDLEPAASVELLRSLGGTLRSAHFDVTAVVVDEELLELEPGDTTARRFAIAFDLGTTTVVATLLDLDSGTAARGPLDAQPPAALRRRRDHPDQRRDDGPGGARRVASRAHETMSELTSEVCAEAGVAPAEVYEITVCGNVTMMQLALGIDPEPLSMAPFVVSTHTFPPARAAEFGVEFHPRAPAFVFPSLGAYVGGDIVAGMLATGLTRDRRLRLFIDVGTNSEIALGCSDAVLATAAPAGPAFEAAQIKCGMRAADGAIEGLKVDGDSLVLEVIGDAEPVGMCGSGLVDAVAEMVHAGLLDHSGRFLAEEDAAVSHPALADVSRPSARSGCSCSTGAEAIRRSPCSCPSATSASCSSRRHRSRPAGRSC